jgi:hypothetical protein
MQDPAQTASLTLFYIYVERVPSIDTKHSLKETSRMSTAEC